MDVSRSSITHFSIHDDAILQVRGLSERYQLQVDEKYGDIYIKPTRLRDGNFSLFITTQKGHRFIVYCRLSQRGSQSVLFEVIPELTVYRVDANGWVPPLEINDSDTVANPDNTANTSNAPDLSGISGTKTLETDICKSDRVSDAHE
jgi:hypothetical protein